MAKDLGFQRGKWNIFKRDKKESPDNKRFQDIIDKRYQESLEHIHTELNTPKYDAEGMHENALETKKELEAEKDTIFLKKWE